MKLTRLHIVFLIIIGSIYSNKGISQDLSFDQYMKTPTYLNPALTGVIAGNYRIHTTYHNQWAGQLNTNIKGVMLGGDVKFETTSKNGKSDFWGIGISFLNDEYNAYSLSTKTLSINTSFHKMLDLKTRQYIGMGFQLGINQKNISYENLNFEDEFNQVDTYNQTSSEVLPKNNFGYLDYSTGLFYSSDFSDKVHFNIGVGYFHLSQPNVSFYQDVRNPISSLIQESKLNSKINVHAAAAIEIAETLDLIPDFYFQKQGAHQNITFGTRLRLALNYEDIENSVTVGFRGKFSKNYDNTSFSAITMLADYKQKNLTFGFSYNLMLKPLVTDQLSMNIFELSLTYTGHYNTEEYYCPEF